MWMAEGPHRPPPARPSSRAGVWRLRLRPGCGYGVPKKTGDTFAN
jgi:hypothetical protein